MSIYRIHHASMVIADTSRALDFYAGVLGLEVDTSRPELGYRGAWLNIGEAQIHLLELPNPDPATGRPEHGGRDRHVALLVTDLAAIEGALKHASVAYTKSRSGRAALFCRDPDGNAIELIEA